MRIPMWASVVAGALAVLSVWWFVQTRDPMLLVMGLIAAGGALGIGILVAGASGGGVRLVCGACGARNAETAKHCDQCGRAL